MLFKFINIAILYIAFNIMITFLIKQVCREELQKMIKESEASCETCGKKENCETRRKTAEQLKVNEKLNYLHLVSCSDWEESHEKTRRNQRK